jgi:two-component system chemotaxis sensor kinase CheA
MEMGQYLEIFTEETKEHLQGLNQCLLQLEQNPEDIPVLNEIFRAAHTIKGMAGTMGFNKMSKLTHDMENVLHAMRNNELQVTSVLIDLLFRCLDALENYLNEIVTNGSEGDTSYNEIIAELNKVIENKGTQKDKGVEGSRSQEKTQDGNGKYATSGFSLNEYEMNIANKALEQGMNAFKMTVVLNKSCVLKSARAFIVFQLIEKRCEIIKSVPKVQDIEDERFDNEFTVVIVTEADSGELSKEINSVAEIDEVLIVPIDSKQSQGTDSDKKAASQDEKSRNESKTEENDRKGLSEHKQTQSSQGVKTGKTVRVDIERLDNLMNLVSELIIIKTRLDGMTKDENSQSYNEVIEYLERVSTSLHDAVMKVRMVPVETVFNRFPRMIRDISKSLGKEIILKMSGEETELDRTVIDEIGDPLIHLLRNSADHGIEQLEKRKELGKPEAGLISLRAYQDGNNVVIEVEDDGAGMDTEKIRKKAVERGLISKDASKNLSQKEIIDFLFKPSFSTAEQVTDLSGRGVGLDVVKTKIETLGGMVEVESEFGKGSKFIIRLPLTLAIIQALLVVIGEEKYAIPLGSIREIIKVQPADLKIVQKQEVILLRNTVVPVVRIGEILEVPKAETTAPKQLTVVVVKKGERLSGFLVDSLIGQQEIVIKSLGKLLSGIKTIAGATILGDGNVALILDVNSLAI